MDDEGYNDQVLEKLPTISQMDSAIEHALKDLFQENFKTSVIKYKPGLYLVLPPEFFHFPPAIISCEQHPDSDEKILYVIISLRIPVPCNVINDAFLTLRNVILFEVERIRVNETAEELCFLNVGNRLHSLSIYHDPEWFLMMLSSILKSPLTIYSSIREKSQDLPTFEGKAKSSRENIDESIW